MSSVQLIADLPISARMIEATFARYAKPLAGAAPELAVDDEQLAVALPNGKRAVLRAFTFRGWGDVLPSDYLLWEVEGDEPVAAPAPLITAALRALAEARR